MKELSSTTAAVPPSAEPTDLAPLNIIRSETVLSKLPIHNLSKKGKVDISILRRNHEGEVELKWEVSHNERYGQPRQLAYKLDTIIINRRIDEEGRPVPELICLGSLNELCEILGSNKNELKRALQQNATTAINAKLSYKATDGTERRLEALFSRYSIVFTGEELPDGKTADAVYLILNKPYREVLNNAPVRPLNYDYLKSLNPSAQRFYEIISYRVFAALKNNQPYARLAYSDYCLYSAQQRYFNYDQFKKQMFKIHQPHRKSEYLDKVEYEQITDSEGQVDWMMIYTPGPKAKAEYAAFTKQPNAVNIKAGEPQQTKQVKAGQLKTGQVKTGKRAAAALPTPPEWSESQLAVLAALTQRGILESAARKLLADLPEHQPVLDQLEWGDHLIRQGGNQNFRNPPGFYLYLIKSNVAVPEDFETNRRRVMSVADRAARTQADLTERALEQDYEDYRRQAIEEHIRTALSAVEYQALAAAKRQELRRKFPGALWLEGEGSGQIVHGAVRAEIASRLSLPSFEEFRAQEKSRRQTARSESSGPRAIPADPLAALSDAERERLVEYAKQSLQARFHWMNSSNWDQETIRHEMLSLLNAGAAQ